MSDEQVADLGRPLVVPLAAVRRDAVPLVGGKAASLGELAAAGFRVPDGFVVTAAAYLDAVGAAGVRDELGVDGSASADLVGSVRPGSALVAAVQAALAELGPGPVAVRSSATLEDGADASFAGVHATFTDVEGQADVLEHVVDCWASLFDERAVAYRAGLGVGGEPAMAVLVQRMVAAEVSGVIFSRHPATGDPTRLVVEAALGAGEAIVGGEVQPDTYVVDRRVPAVVEAHVGTSGAHASRSPDGERRRAIVDDTVLALARLGIEVEARAGSAQDIEFVLEGGRIHVVQARPVTVPGATSGEGRSDPTEVVVRGIGASAGVASGAVRVLVDPGDGADLVDGEVLVVATTSPAWLPTMRRAAALVTDTGGMTCHAAIVSRELGLPAVVGTGTATERLRDGQPVTVDGSAGVVADGLRRWG